MMSFPLLIGCVCVCVCLPLRTSKLTFFEDFERDEEEVVVGRFGVCLVRVVI